MARHVDDAAINGSADRPPDPAPLPDGSVLLHIGPPKSGTTALQASFWAARADALAQGVRYAGYRRHSIDAVRAVIGRPTQLEATSEVPMRRWRRLAREVRGATERLVVVSSEWFARAPEDAIPRLVGELGGDRVRVVATLRPIPLLLASAWQEGVQHGQLTTYDAWLRATLDDPSSATLDGFWFDQRHDRLLARWAAATAPDRVTAVVLGDDDRGHVYRVFEDLTGLTRGTLAPVHSLANRSLTAPEVTALQAFARRYAAQGLDMRAFHWVGREVVARHLKQRSPKPDEPRIETPQWALDAAGAVAREVAAAVAASGVQVIGDVEALAAVPRSRLASDGPQAVDVSPDLVAEIAMSLVLGADRVARWVAPPAASRPPAGRSRGVAAPVSRAVRRLLRRAARPFRGRRRPGRQHRPRQRSPG